MVGLTRAQGLQQLAAGQPLSPEQRELQNREAIGSMGEFNKGLRRFGYNALATSEAAIGQLAEPFAPQFAKRRIAGALDTLKRMPRQYEPAFETFASAQQSGRVGDYARYAAGALGEGLPTVATVLGGGLVGRGIATGLRAAPATRNLAQMAGGVGTAFPMEAGETALQLQTSPQAMANTTAGQRALYAAGRGATNAALEYAVPAALMSNAIRGARAAPGLRGGLGAVGRYSLAGGVGEAGTEAAQDLTGQYVMNRAVPGTGYDLGQAGEAAIRGGIVGSVVGGGAGTVNAIRSNLQEGTDQIREKAVPGALDAAVSGIYTMTTDPEKFGYDATKTTLSALERMGNTAREKLPAARRAAIGAVEGTERSVAELGNRVNKFILDNISEENQSKYADMAANIGAMTVSEFRVFKAILEAESGTQAFDIFTAETATKVTDDLPRAGRSVVDWTRSAARGINRAAREARRKYTPQERADFLGTLAIGNKGSPANVFLERLLDLKDRDSRAFERQLNMLFDIRDDAAYFDAPNSDALRGMELFERENGVPLKGVIDLMRADKQRFSGVERGDETPVPKQTLGAGQWLATTTEKMQQRAFSGTAERVADVPVEEREVTRADTARTERMLQQESDDLAGQANKAMGPIGTAALKAVGVDVREEADAAIFDRRLGKQASEESRLGEQLQDAKLYNTEEVRQANKDRDELDLDENGDPIQDNIDKPVVSPFNQNVLRGMFRDEKFVRKTTGPVSQVPAKVTLPEGMTAEQFLFITGAKDSTKTGDYKKPEYRQLTPEEKAARINEDGTVTLYISPGSVGSMIGGATQPGELTENRTQQENREVFEQELGAFRETGMDKKITDQAERALAGLGGLNNAGGLIDPALMTPSMLKELGLKETDEPMPFSIEIDFSALLPGTILQPKKGGGVTISDLPGGKTALVPSDPESQRQAAAGTRRTPGGSVTLKGDVERYKTKIELPNYGEVDIVATIEYKDRNQKYGVIRNKKNKRKFDVVTNKGEPVLDREGNPISGVKSQIAAIAAANASFRGPVPPGNKPLTQKELRERQQKRQSDVANALLSERAYKDAYDIIVAFQNQEIYAEQINEILALHEPTLKKFNQKDLDKNTLEALEATRAATARADRDKAKARAKELKETLAKTPRSQRNTARSRGVEQAIREENLKVQRAEQLAQDVREETVKLLQTLGIEAASSEMMMPALSQQKPDSVYLDKFIKSLSDQYEAAQKKEEISVSVREGVSDTTLSDRDAAFENQKNTAERTETELRQSQKNTVTPAMRKSLDAIQNVELAPFFTPLEMKNGKYVETLNGQVDATSDAGEILKAQMIGAISQAEDEAALNALRPRMQERKDELNEEQQQQVRDAFSARKRTMRGEAVTDEQKEFVKVVERIMGKRVSVLFNQKDLGGATARYEDAPTARELEDQRRNLLTLLKTPADKRDMTDSEIKDEIDSLEEQIGAIHNDKAVMGFIRVAEGVDPIGGIAEHEAFHAAFSIFMSGANQEDRRIVGTAFRKGLASRQLINYYGSDPQILAVIDPNSPTFNAEEAAAYAFQLYSINPTALKLGQRGKGVFEKIKALFRALFGIQTYEQRAERIFRDLLSGERAQKGITPLRPSMAMEESLLEHARGLGRSVLQGAQTIYDALLTSSYTRLEDGDNPALAQIAKLGYTATGEQGQAGYIQNARRRRTEFGNRVVTALSGLNEDQLAELRTQLVLGERGEGVLGKRYDEVRTLLDDLLQYQQEAGLSVGEKENYFPLVWDPTKVAEKETEFLEMLDKYSEQMSTFRKTKFDVYRDIVSYLQRGSEFTDVLSSNNEPTSDSYRERTMDFISREDREAFMPDDPVQILHQYVQQAVRHAEYVRSYGKEGVRLAQLKREAVETYGATKEQVDRAQDFVDGLVGNKEIGMSRDLKDVYGALTVYQNVRLLPLTVFSSFVDPMGVAVRTNDMTGAFETFAYSIRNLFRDWKSEYTPDQWEQIATDFGVVDMSGTVKSVDNIFTGMTLRGRTKDINDKFFKYNLLNGWVKNNHIMATKLAMKFMQRSAENFWGTEQSERYLAELGLNKEDIIFDESLGRIRVYADEIAQGDTSESGRKAAAEQEQRIRMAVHRVVTQSMIQPSTADLPGWMANPYLAPIAHLKTFVFGFNNTIINRVTNEAREGNNYPLYAAAAYVPGMIAADFIRDMIGNFGDEPEYKKEWGLADYTWNGFKRSGLMGTGAFFTDMQGDLRRGGSGWESLTGPSAEQAQQFVRALDSEDSRLMQRWMLKAMPANSVYDQFVM